MNVGIENYNKAKDYFNLQKGFVLHHIDPTLKYRDPERYAEWRIEDLTVMERFEHLALHSRGELNGFYGKHHTEESKEKNRQAHLGKTHTDEWKKAQGERRKGTHHSEETKSKQSLSMKAYWANKKGA